MRRTLMSLLRPALVCSALGVALAAWWLSPGGSHTSVLPASTAQAAPATNPPNFHRGLVVHEWGTFTSFSGSDGVRLEFRPLADNDLPDFVFHRGKQAGAIAPFAKAQYFVRERMETPVTYFYTDREREVRVKVGFPQGLLTEFYPPVESMKPAFEAVKVQKLRDSELDWGRVRLIPEVRLKTEVTDPVTAQAVQQRLLGALLPQGYGNHYEFARETDSALVHVHLPAEAPWTTPAGSQLRAKPQGDFFEKFLFYRGIGSFQLPIHVEANADGRFTVRNGGAEEIRALFLLTAEGEKLRLATAEKIEPHGRLTMTVEHTTTLNDLSAAVVKALVAEGLYEKEARAMVKTWQTSWFGEQGTRLFYMLPRRITDELLPLSIAPAPDEIVRVMVGRYEIMSPEDEARVTKLVEQSILTRKDFEAKAAQDEKVRAAGYTLPEGIVALGRLAEPALVRVKTIAKDPATKNEAALLLQSWEVWKNAN